MDTGQGAGHGTDTWQDAGRRIGMRDRWPELYNEIAKHQRPAGGRRVLPWKKPKVWIGAEAVMLVLLLLVSWCRKVNPEIWPAFSAQSVFTRTLPADAGDNGQEADKAQGAEELQQAEESKKICITFDDGPHPYYTEELLDGLWERGVVATFFVTGEHATLHPDIILRMSEEGHLIGNHTYSHIQLRPDNREAFKEELLLTNTVITQITGEEVLFVRPPYGTWDKALEEELNMIPVLWTIDPLDWCSEDVACITEKIVSNAEENAIILLHDYYETSVTAALSAIDILLEQGYTFVTVDEIIFD